MKSVNESKFYQALENIFTGAAIEGESGYVNLLKVKSSYYKLILEKFKKEVDAEPILTESFKEEFFDKLYSFFEKYFSESGSVYFVKTANWQRVYEQVYTDNKDVVLFWKTHMLYYVKSDILFQSINVAIDEEESKQTYHFYFDVGTLKAKQNNEKKSLVFTFREISDTKNSEKNTDSKKAYLFDVAYSESGNKTKIEDIVKITKVPEEIIEKALQTFRKQSEVDFFINKNAEKFLTEQLDMYLHQILLHEENKFDQKRLDQIKTIKQFAQKIISFVAQFEDELVRVWNKPKFAINSNYVITLDRLSREVLGKLSQHVNLPAQIKEWQDLEMIDSAFKFEEQEEKYKYLPIDTKYFKDLEIEILNLFDNLDEELDGRLIHSENYQALNTLQEKYKGKIKCIYIDPPFNLGENADFDYKVNYKDANWTTLLENRIRLAKKFVSEDGSIFVRCDYNGNFIVRCLLDDIFGKENFRNEIIVSKSNQQGEMDLRFNPATDFLYFYSMGKINPIRKAVERKEEKWLEMHSPKQNTNSHSVVVKGDSFIAPKNRHWTFSQVKVDLMIKEGRIRVVEKVYMDVYGNSQSQILEYRLNDSTPVDSNWTDIPGYSYSTGFTTENSEPLLQRVIHASSQKGDLIMDFFMGSGTTQAVAQKLGRKWLGIEMGDQFDAIDLQRLKKIYFGKQSGISKDLLDKYKGGGLFKYESLEQYEDSLRNMKYKDCSPNSIFDIRKPFEQYVFYADQKFADVLEMKEDSMDIDFDKLYPNIDFAETISNLLGLPIKSITASSVILQEGDSIREVKTDYKSMSSEEKIAFVRLLKPLLWWGE